MSAPAHLARAATASLSSSSSSGGTDTVTLAIAVVCMVLVPILTSAVYVIDKVAIARRVQYTSSYIALVGFYDVGFGLVIACFVNWFNITVTFMDLLWPVLAGIFFGIATMFYVFALEGEDVSRIVGIENTYPLLVTVLSAVFLDDILSPLAYVGILITCGGAVLLSIDPGPVIFKWIKKCLNKGNYQSVDMVDTEAATSGAAEQDALLSDGKPKEMHAPRTKLATMMLVAPLIISLGLSEFFTKLSTDSLPALAVSAISYALYGMIMGGLIVMPSSRKHAVYELKRNWPWPLFSESFMVGSNITLSFAMASLSAPIVSSVAASAPLFTLLLEFVFRVADDNCFTFLVYKLVPISITVGGVILLSLTSIS